MQILVQLRSDRAFHHLAAPYLFRPDGGRPARYGAEFPFKDPATWGPQDIETYTDTSFYGQSTALAWTHLHPRLQRRSEWAHWVGPMPILEGAVAALPEDPQGRTITAVVEQRHAEWVTPGVLVGAASNPRPVGGPVTGDGPPLLLSSRKQTSAASGQFWYSIIGLATQDAVGGTLESAADRVTMPVGADGLVFAEVASASNARTGADGAGEPVVGSRLLVRRIRQVPPADGDTGGTCARGCSHDPQACNVTRRSDE